MLAEAALALGVWLQLAAGQEAPGRGRTTLAVFLLEKAKYLNRQHRDSTETFCFLMDPFKSLLCTAAPRQSTRAQEDGAGGREMRAGAPFPGIPQNSGESPFGAQPSSRCSMLKSKETARKQQLLAQVSGLSLFQQRAVATCLCFMQYVPVLRAARSSEQSRCCPGEPVAGTWSPRVT
ncbi:hypothetical protein Anapl_04503 [Anas platyrhynchos]|uniref:Uncharacterized protein n=1 Tax=Anas platyrhynchos TaxID=8839 RepID=R0KFM1_ANAPL|nr:hypothetical protein Anapl_04503 [Anas platyrhynchos]